MSKGIYGYWDNIKQKVVYIGQTNDIRRRLNEHMYSCKYDTQPFNQILQNTKKGGVIIWQE